MSAASHSVKTSLYLTNSIKSLPSTNSVMMKILFFALIVSRNFSKFGWSNPLMILLSCLTCLKNLRYDGFLFSSQSECVNFLHRISLVVLSLSAFANNWVFTRTDSHTHFVFLVHIETFVVLEVLHPFFWGNFIFEKYVLFWVNVVLVTDLNSIT